MKLCDLLPALSEYRLSGDAQRQVGRLRYDSRRVAERDLFFAWRGVASDGHRFIPDVVARGASAVVVEDPAFAPAGNASCVVVPDSRRALARMAALYHGNPSRLMQTVGITGTNGKTTSAFTLKHLLKASGLSTGLMGTIQYEIGDRILPASRTTPEGCDLQDYLAQMREAGVAAVAMEVSSHALEQGRVEGVDFQVAVFTNLTRDHLDFHKTMEDYFKAKALLFSSLKPGSAAVVNIDDAYGRTLAATIPAGVRLITFSAKGERSATLTALNTVCALHGNTFVLRYEGVERDCRVPLVGRFNVENVLAAIGSGIALGLSVEKMVEDLKSVPGVPGRLELFQSSDGVSVVVDYAHTDDALKNVLQTLREVKPSRLGVVLGCGGNRDAGKRPKMAQAAREYADWAIFTSDNPRNEKAQDILRDMEAGVSGWADYTCCEDRGEAIAQALAKARNGDVICVAGKGHESTQEIEGRMIPWDDRAVVRDLLKRRGGLV